MVRIRKIKQYAFRLRLVRRGDQKANYTNIYYVGLGDKFDDDRALVRASKALPDDVRGTRPAYTPGATADEQ
jgi:hypothetical protein